MPFRSSDFDDNRSVWLADKPPYSPAAPLSRDVSADVAIIGGGFTGVSTAYHLAKRFPDKRIVLLEAKTLASGASGRNGGLMLNWVNGVHTDDPAQARAIFDATQEGMSTIMSMIADNNLNVRHRRDGVFDIITKARNVESAAREVEKLNGVGIPLKFVSTADLPSRLRVDGVHGAIFDPTAGQIDGVDLIRGMRPVLEKLDVGIYENTAVTRIAEGEIIELQTTGGSVRANAIVLATNAYTPSLGYFGSNVCAVHSHVIATEPLSQNQWRELGWNETAGFCDDLDRLAYASMTPDGRLVFGGGSNGSYSYVFGNRPAFHGDASAGYDAVHARLLQYMPKLNDVRIAQQWTGAVALTLSRVCTMGVRGAHKNVYFALGYSGHGITLANLSGRVLTDIYSGDDARWRGLPFYQQSLLYIPPEPFRWMGYQIFTKLTGRSPKKTVTPHMLSADNANTR